MDEKPGEEQQNSASTHPLLFHPSLRAVNLLLFLILKSYSGPFKVGLLLAHYLCKPNDCAGEPPDIYGVHICSDSWEENLILLTFQW